MKQDIFKGMHGTTPESFKSRVYYTLRKTEVQPVKQKFALRTALIAAAILVLCMGLVYAAFSSQVTAFFGRFYGNDMKTWLEEGDVALPAQSFTMGEVTFTLEEVVYRDNGLYGVGIIRPEEGSNAVLLPWGDYLPSHPFGYNVMYGDEAPEGAPTIADVAREKGGKLLWVNASPDQIGVDGGTMLSPATVGFSLNPQRDGSIRFAFEISDGYAVEEGDAYTIKMWACVNEITMDGESLDDTFRGEYWTVEGITPTPMSTVK